MATLNATALIILTGNGLTVTEDLARRFLEIQLDPGIEDPETRKFPTDVRADVRTRRNTLLAALITIWRWGPPFARPKARPRSWELRDMVCLGARSAVSARVP